MIVRDGEGTSRFVTLHVRGARSTREAEAAARARPNAHKIVFAFRRGHPTNTALKKLAKITSAPEFDLHVDLHLGRGEFTMYASDLTENYVALNKGDVNDPTSLGG